MTAAIKFGTDGWRAVIAEDYTFDNVRACSQAVAYYLKDSGLDKEGMVVGYDTRFASESFAAAAAEVLAGNGIHVYLSDRACPTPVVSFNLKRLSTSGAIIITASHNPGQWNGFKVKEASASSASPEVIADIEARIPNIQMGTRKLESMSIEEAHKNGLVEYFNPSPPYLDHIEALIGKDRLEGIKNAGINIVVDSMYGAGAGYTRRLLSRGKTRVTEIHGVRNPAFPGIQPEPIGRNLAELCDTIKRKKAQVGLATDGDADRLGVMDENGEFVTQLQVFSLLALYLLEVRGERGPIIKTITTSNMIYRLGELFDSTVVETDVGFKYVGPEMMKRDALIGGEESGGYGFRGHIPERDGILAGLYFLDLMVKTGKTPAQLVEYLYSKVGPHYYDRIDLHFPPGERDSIVERVSAAQPAELNGTGVARKDSYYDDEKKVSGVRFSLENGAWLLIRFSGTEPVLRVYAEAGSLNDVKELLAAGKELAGV
ncbi:MAG: phosphoglucomutase/phosphomannomutase family protein [Dehalococcoidia bacterium]|nr:phosphoglucomutase/phosphomannomutase family protein [Dehalococcoidia bacterium]